MQHGVLLGSAGQGRVSAAARADLAEAAATVLSTDGHAGQAYELGGDEAYSLEQIAAEISAQSGKEVRYLDQPEAEYARVLVQAGVPETMAAVIADSDVGLSRGELRTDSDALRRLIGHPTTTLKDAVAEALRKLEPNDGAAIDAS